MKNITKNYEQKQERLNELKKEQAIIMQEILELEEDISRHNESNGWHYCGTLHNY